MSSVYSIPALEATGQHRFDEGPAPTTPLSMKKLRLLAARAHADVLVVVDYARRTSVTPNAFAIFDVLILPTLFLPFRDVKVESAVDAFVVDVRNGYMYGHVALTKTDTKPNQTIYADDDAMTASQWTALTKELEDALVRLAAASTRDAAEHAIDAGKTAAKRRNLNMYPTCNWDERACA